MENQKELCIFFVVTENEINSGVFESCISTYLDQTPSLKYKSDFFIFCNKINAENKITKIAKLIKSSEFVNSIQFINLDLDENLDCFWYPWSTKATIKPAERPRLGYTSGANELFYRSIKEMFKKDYKNFLMLESDTKPIKENWFDLIFDYAVQNNFEIAGSIYKGIADWHKNSEYKNHINGVAIYKNSSKTKSLINFGEREVERECKEKDFLNFDVANLIASNKSKKEYILQDTGVIINISDPVDSGYEIEDILKKNPKAAIIHQKPKIVEPILRPEAFDGFYDESIPVYFCIPKSGSEYILSLNKSLLETKSKKDKTKNAIIKIISEKDSKIILYCKADVNFKLLQKDLFIDQSDNEYLVNEDTLLLLLSKNHLNIFSAALDFRFSKGSLDFEIYRILFSILSKIQKSPAFYCFLRHPFLILKSLFPSWEAANFSDSNVELQEKRRRFNYFSTLSPSSFLQKKIIGNSYGSIPEQRDHFEAVIENFYIYDISMANEVMSSIFKHYCDISLKDCNDLDIEINPTKNKYNIDLGVFMKSEVARNVWAVKNSEDLEFHNKIMANKETPKSFSNIDMTKTTKKFRKNIPVFFHIPKNAGTFAIASMNKYFLRILNVKRDDFNMQRLSVRTHNGNEVKCFVYFNDEKWQEDKNIKVFQNFGPTVRARECSFDTFKNYLSRDLITLLSVVIEPSGPIVDLRDCFYTAWSFIKNKGLNPVNFCILRNPFDRAASIYNYLTSEKSSHEKTHGAFGGLKSFNEYVNSEMLEDSWLIRAVTGMPDNTPVNSHWKEEAKEFIIKNNFKLKDIKESLSLVNEVLEYCYEESVIEADVKTVNKNESRSKKQSIKDLSVAEREVFTRRVKWDLELYQNLI